MNTLSTERIIIEHIDRYTIAIDRCIPVADRERAMLTIDRLLSTRKISNWTHESQLRYWTRWSRRPLGNRSLVRSVGISLFCHDSARSIVTRTEIEDYFPQLFRHGLPGGHYIDRSPQHPRLGHIRVDAGQSKINRMIARTENLIHKYRRQPGFRELIDENRFELTWIVPTKPKQRRLSESLDRFTTTDTHVKVVAIPELLNIIAPVTSV